MENGEIEADFQIKILEKAKLSFKFRACFVQITVYLSLLFNSVTIQFKLIHYYLISITVDLFFILDSNTTQKEIYDKACPRYIRNKLTKVRKLMLLNVIYLSTVITSNSEDRY